MVGDEFLGMDIKELESKNKNKKDYDYQDIIFPNLKSLQFEGLESLDNREEWIGMEEEEKKKKKIVLMLLLLILQ